jgi:uncharacterized protein YcnI
MFKKIAAALAFTLVLLTPAVASAHVKILPYQAGTGEDLVFSVSVPNEGTTATTKLKLLVPDGVKYVSPVARSDWKITTNKATNGDVKSITWSNGKLPPHRSADFEFRAATPKQATQLDWKAIQTYDDGTVVKWNQPPQKGKREAKSKTAGPYSITYVNSSFNPAPAATNQSNSNTAPLVLSIIALVLAALAVAYLGVTHPKVKAAAKQRKNRN